MYCKHLPGAGISWFPKGVAGKGTAMRENGLPNLYKNKLIPLDARYHNNPTQPERFSSEKTGKLWEGAWACGWPLGRLQQGPACLGQGDGSNQGGHQGQGEGETAIRQ